MPAKNSVKTFVENGYYHIYNRGVEKREIFQDEQDYRVFLGYLDTYLSTKDIFCLQETVTNPNATSIEKAEAIKLLRMNNFSDSIDVIAYCLMPNHFHLLLKQKTVKAMDTFMNSLITRYSMYFNKRNKRVGHLFQGPYKAVLVENEYQFIYLSKYIHLNPGKLKFSTYKYSSYQDYIGRITTRWIKPNIISGLFARTNVNSYENFISEGTSFDMGEQIGAAAIDYGD